MLANIIGSGLKKGLFAITKDLDGDVLIEVGNIILTWFGILTSIALVLHTLMYTTIKSLLCSSLIQPKRMNDEAYDVVSWVGCCFWETRRFTHFTCELQKQTNCI